MSGDPNAKRLGLNRSGYAGATIDIIGVLADMRRAAEQHRWHIETFGESEGYPLMAFTRVGSLPSARRFYISSGIHGDEPAGPSAALRLLRENLWPEDAVIVLCPCLNPGGFAANRRENIERVDLNRDYKQPRTGEIRAHVAWLSRQKPFTASLCLHEDWESNGFYVYELNPDRRTPIADTIVEAVRQVCPVDMATVIEGREAYGGIIRPSLDPSTRPLWPESFWLLQHKSRLSATLEAPSDFALPVRVAALVAGVRAVLETCR